MNAAPALIGYAAAVGLLAPRMLLRAHWPHRNPILAVAVWSAFAISFSLSLALAALHVGNPSAHLHGILYSCGVALGVRPPAADTMGRIGVAASAAVVAAQLTGFVFHVLRARAARASHREVLDKVGRWSAELGAVVLEHAMPAAYCLPGRHARIVVSSGAVDVLSADELAAVVAHERAHINGRHHLLLAAAHAFGIAFRRLPLARRLREQVPLLLEMLADDRALRSCRHEVLATALFEMASGGSAPRGALSAGGPTALLRLQRILAPPQNSHPAIRGAMSVTALVMPLLPVLVACPPGLGQVLS